MAIRSGVTAYSTVVETFDAAGVAGLTKRLPKESRHRYRLRDPAAAASCAGPLCRHVLRAAGDLQVSWVDEQLGTQVDILEPGIAAHCFATIHSGEMALYLPTEPDAARG